MGLVEDIQEQRELLAMRLRQIATDDVAHTAHHLCAERDHARAAIARMKAILRMEGVWVEDHPDDRAPTGISMGSPVTALPIDVLIQPFPLSVRPQVRSMVEHATEIFGGRVEELAQLDAFLSADTPYALLLAPRGRGKTALLIQWAIQVHKRGEWQVIFVPITIRAQPTAADMMLRVLMLALATVHGEQAAFEHYRPAPEARRAIIADYLRRPLPEGRRLLVVLDGLDETMRWVWQADLFPQMPPAHVRVICAARPVVHKTVMHWLTDLGWQSEIVRYMTLEGLDAATVQDILARMGNPLDDLATDVDIINEIGRISKGDPLTIRMLIEALRDGDIQPHALPVIPPGREAFMREWLANLEAKSARLIGIRTLLGLCAVALGPLTSEDALALAPEIFLHRVRLKQVAGAVAHVIIGDGTEAQGYVFKHPRLRELFGERVLLQHEREDLQARLVAWGARCYAAYRHAPQAHPIPTYLRQFWVTHLVAAGAWAQVHEVLTEAVAVQRRMVQPWASAQYAAERSYTGYLTDLDGVWDNAEQQQHIVLAIQCALIVASIHTQKSTPTKERLIDGMTVGPSSAGGNHARIPTAVVRVLPERGSAERWAEGIAVGQTIRDGWAEALAETRPDVPEGRTTAEVIAVAREIREEGDRVRALVGIAPYLPEGDQATVWDEALATARRIEDAGLRTHALVGIAPHLPEGDQATVWDEALATARRIEDAGLRTHVLVGIAPYLPEGDQATVWDEALSAARRIEDAGRRTHALVEIAPHCVAHHFSRAMFLPTLRCLAIQDRPALIRDLAALMPWIMTLTTPEEQSAIIQAMREVTQCWP